MEKYKKITVDLSNSNATQILNVIDCCTDFTRVDFAGNFNITVKSIVEKDKSNNGTMDKILNETIEDFWQSNSITWQDSVCQVEIKTSDSSTSFEIKLQKISFGTTLTGGDSEWFLINSNGDNMKLKPSVVEKRDDLNLATLIFSLKVAGISYQNSSEDGGILKSVETFFKINN